MRKQRKNENGITIVALVITIVILLILAGISISTLTNTGIFEKAKEAQRVSENAEKEQSKILDEYEREFNKYSSEELTTANANTVLSTTENVELHDKNGNKIVVPAGFKVVANDDTNNAMIVDKGIVIEDATVDSNGNATSTNGSQFVWVPVGNIIKEDGKVEEIKLDRYTFDSNGVETPQGEKLIEEWAIELEESDKGNTVSKSISNFKNSVLVNRGYYIGRYEARQNNGQISERKMDTVWYKITQSEAAAKARNMYNNTDSFTSDLINSYAWDTAIVFIQKSANIKYSIKNSINTGYVAENGTTDDVKCNIYDMASNVSEWSIETSNILYSPCIGVGGNFYYKKYFTANRNYLSKTYNEVIFGFRPLLYLNI